MKKYKAVKGLIPPWFLFLSDELIFLDGIERVYVNCSYLPWPALHTATQTAQGHRCPARTLQHKGHTGQATVTRTPREPVPGLVTRGVDAGSPATVCMTSLDTQWWTRRDCYVTLLCLFLVRLIPSLLMSITFALNNMRAQEHKGCCKKPTGLHVKILIKRNSSSFTNLSNLLSKVSFIWSQSCHWEKNHTECRQC